MVDLDRIYENEIRQTILSSSVCVADVPQLRCCVCVTGVSCIKCLCDRFVIFHVLERHISSVYLCHISSVCVTGVLTPLFVFM